MVPGSHITTIRTATASVLLALAAGAVRAQPTVQVGAATRIELQSSHRAESARIRGVLLDDQDAPVPDSHVELRVQAADGEGTDIRRTLRTGHDGTFRADLQLAPGRYRVFAGFTGLGHHDGSVAERDVDLTRADVRLRVVRPHSRRIDLDESRVTLDVRASSARGGDALKLVVEDELGRELARGTTDAAGRLTVDVASTALGHASVGRLIVRSEGDAQRVAARTEVAILRTRATRLTLAAVTGSAEHEDAIRLRGELRTSVGPLERRAVGIFDGERHLATVLTDREGRFTYSGPQMAPAEAATHLRLSARFDSDAPWFVSSRSEVIDVERLAPSTPTSLWLLWPVAISALVMWWLSRRSNAQPTLRELSPLRETRVGVDGATPARGRPTIRSVEGRVVSADHGRALGDAQIELIAAGGVRLVTAETTDTGFFATGPLDDGPWTLRIVAPGYTATAQQITIPHRGEWSGLVARLQSLRTAALRAFEPAAAVTLSSRDQLPQATPRDVVAHARIRGRASAALSALASRVEHAVFGRAFPRQSDVDSISRAARQIEHDEGVAKERRAPP